MDDTCCSSSSPIAYNDWLIVSVHIPRIIRAWLALWMNHGKEYIPTEPYQPCECWLMIMLFQTNQLMKSKWIITVSFQLMKSKRIYTNWTIHNRPHGLHGSVCCTSMPHSQWVSYHLPPCFALYKDLEHRRRRKTHFFFLTWLNSK